MLERKISRMAAATSVEVGGAPVGGVGWGARPVKAAKPEVELALATIPGTPHSMQSWHSHGTYSTTRTVGSNMDGVADIVGNATPAQGTEGALGALVVSNAAPASEATATGWSKLYDDGASYVLVGCHCSASHQYDVMRSKWMLVLLQRAHGRHTVGASRGSGVPS